MVQKRRHLVKAITYRLSTSTMTFCIILAVTGRIDISLIVTPIELVAKVAFYYLHERIWLKSKFGVVKNLSTGDNNEPF